MNLQRKSKFTAEIGQYIIGRRPGGGTPGKNQ